MPVDVISEREILEQATQFMSDGQPHHIITANSLMALELKKRPELKNVFNNAELMISDSSGISWAARHLGYSHPPRIPGIDLAYKLCALAESKQHSVYLLGAQPGVAHQAARFLYKEFPYLHISGMRDGYFQPDDTPAIIQDIANSHAKLVLVSLGMPQQECWIYQHFAKLPGAIYMGVGGTFDVWSGQLKRAPQWMQKKGIEWLYRLSQQPHRISRMAKLPQFAFKVIQSKRGHKISLF